MNEAQFIAGLRALAVHPGALGLNDDCAVIEVGGEALVLTHDVMVAGVHFLPRQDPADIAWKLLATNLSDLAAKGAEPIGVLLGYPLDKRDGGDARFLAGLGEALDHYRVPLLGGDTVSGAADRTLGLTAIGRATHRPVPARGGARIGEDVWLTGPVGAAMLGLEALRQNDAAPAEQDAAAERTRAYRRPKALLSEGMALAPIVGAMMDVSDGLLLDATRMARASGVTLALESAEIPLAVPEVRRDEALRWGDDYQLLFTAPRAAALPVPAHRIGTVIAPGVAPGAAPLLLDGAAPAGTLGYEHG